ncbi:MAG: Holliday junction DNA helicase RuvA [Chloroflexi bacterium RBG_19FT_COMBO_47_9]|nr:MAG: Holliday junction DNA helicase RuvA [Chloroflexi bacterium RBG_19FT_COMBO_47_9]
MIALLHGTVAVIDEDSITLDVGGVGFQVYVPVALKDHLQIGEALFLFTRLIVREELLALYGFETKEGREFFDLLRGVNGVGPRSALAILSTLTPDVIRRAVFNEQEDVFCRAPGIGKRTAQKILLHLQDRIPKGNITSHLAVLSDIDSEVLAALTTLGYSVVEAQAALQYLPKDASQDIEERLRLALQYFTKP